MSAFSVRVRILLALETLLLLGGGLFGAFRSAALPYGRGWALGLGAGILAAVVPAATWVAYQQRASRLMKPRLFELGVEEIPKKGDHTYLGEGFVWGPAQTRTLLDRLAAPDPGRQAANEEIAGDWEIHGIGGDRWAPLYLPDRLLNQHLFLMGAPGSGKTRGLELLVEQAVSRGDAVVVIDPKGDEGLLDRTYDSSVRHGRRGQFRVLALPYPYQSSRYNPLECFISPSDVADRICSIMPGRGGNEAFRNFAWQFVSTVATGIHRLGETVSLAKIEDYCFHNAWLLARKLMAKLCPGLKLDGDPSTQQRHYQEYCSLNKRSFIEIDQVIALASIEPEYFGKIAGALKTILAKLASGSVGYLLCPQEFPVPEPLAGKELPCTLSWEGIDTERLVVYFFLGSLIGPDSASATARMALADLMSYVGRKYAFDEASGFSTRRLTVVVDEVADALAPESVNILNKARGAGLSMVLAGQSLADLEVALGSTADARRALANMGSFITLRAANPDDARYISEKVGTRPQPVVTRGEHYEPSLLALDRRATSDFAYRFSTSSTLRGEPLLPTSALDRLAPGHFFGLWAGELRKGVLALLHPPTHLYSPLLKKGEPRREEVVPAHPETAAPAAPPRAPSVAIPPTPPGKVPL